MKVNLPRKAKGWPNEREIFLKIKKKYVLQRTECEKLIVNPQKKEENKECLSMSLLISASMESTRWKTEIIDK